MKSGPEKKKKQNLEKRKILQSNYVNGCSGSGRRTEKARLLKRKPDPWRLCSSRVKTGKNVFLPDAESSRFSVTESEEALQLEEQDAPS